MGTRIATFEDGTHLEFDRGRFDDYCVFLVAPDGSKYAPTDSFYFQTLVDCISITNSGVVWECFLEVYESTGDDIDPKVIKLINGQAINYGHLYLDYKKSMSMVYAGMIAENRKRFTRLGKRIKRLGLEVLIHEGGSVKYAANFMRGKTWREIDSMCTDRGF